jgi:hypothetical protein
MPSVVTLTGPGTATVTDDAALAIGAQTLAIVSAIGSAEIPGTISACLAEISANLGRIADQDKAIAKSISDLNIAVGTMAAASSENNSMQAMVAANQIATNNFQVAVTKEALTRAGIDQPTMPTLEDQMKTAVSDGVKFNIVATANGGITHFITSTITNTGQWIAGTAAYQTVSAWANKIKDSIASIEIPSAESLASRIKTGKIT